MINIDYCLSLDDFLALLDENRAEMVTGVCKKCVKKKRCRFTDKEKLINTLLSMEPSQSRFPKILSMLQSNPQLLYSVPAFLYMKMYGNGRDYLECPYLSSKVYDNIDSVKAVYNLLTTQESKLCFLNILAYRITLNRDYISRAYSPYPQYFISEFRNLGKNEVYVDCGAFIGDTIDLYCKYNDYPKKAYLFEPDEKNLKALKKNVEKFKDKTNITIIPKGLYNSTCRLYFTHGMGSDSHFSETPSKNCSAVDVVSLDDMINDRVSFIKMDIEGSEYNAVLGAQRIISGNYPKLAICLYHSIDDLWRIPLLIKDMFPEYTNFEIHQHKTFFSETVLYAWRNN